MSLNQEELEKHCETIMSSRRVKDKVVVLCEGDISEYRGRRSPQAYRELEKCPDANFYKACVWWDQYKPEFFNCGDRKDVLDTFFTLSDWHSEPIANSYLDPTRLFAIVDMDIQVQEIGDYDFSDTEEIFHDLYDGMNVNERNAVRHRIWVTGLIHKEAYFLIPKLQAVFDSRASHLNPTYNGKSLRLEDIYLAMSDAITEDIDLHNNLQRACDRIRYCSGLDCTGTDRLKESWRERFQNVQDDAQRDELIFALLTIKKAKAYWNQIGTADNEWTRPVGDFREQLMLQKIAHFYSEIGKSDNNPKYHIPFFLKTLHEFI